MKILATKRKTGWLHIRQCAIPWRSVVRDTDAEKRQRVEEVLEHPCARWGMNIPCPRNKWQRDATRQYSALSIELELVANPDVLIGLILYKPSSGVFVFLHWALAMLDIFILRFGLGLRQLSAAKVTAVLTPACNRRDCHHPPAQLANIPNV